MREQVLLLTIIVIIAMKLFAQEDKLKNYDTFQSMVYKPAVELGSEENLNKLPSVGSLDVSANGKALHFVQPSIEPIKTPTSPSEENVSKKEDTPPKANPLNGLINFSKNYSWLNPVAPVGGTSTPFLNGEMQANLAKATPGNTEEEAFKPLDKSKLNLPKNKLFGLAMKAIGKVETNNDFKYMRWDTGKNGSKGSGAWGKYQFIGRDHQAAIKKVTGLSLAQFLKDEGAQDKYFAYHYQKNLMPLFIKARKSGLVNHLSDVEIMGGLHFRMNDFLPMFANGTASAKANNNPTLTGHIAKIRKAAYGA